MLNLINLKLVGDSALFMSQHFRTNSGLFWTLSNPRDNIQKIKEAATDVILESVYTLDLIQLLMSDDFHAFTKIKIDNHAFNKENLPRHFKVRLMIHQWSEH